MRPAYQGDAAALAMASRYAIAFQVEADGRFEGRQVVRMTNSETAALDRLVFRLLPNGRKSYGGGSLEVRRAVLNGAVLPVTLNDDATVLELGLPQPLQVGDSLTITLDFAGAVPHDFGPNGPGGGGDETGYGIFNLAKNVLSLANAYPILAVYDAQGWNVDPVSAIGDSVYSDMSFYSVKLCLPSGWTVAATGVEVSRDDECSWHVGGPVRDFFIAASPDFKMLEQQVGQVMVRSIYLPDDKAAAQQALTIAVRAVEVFEQRFGEYVFNQLDVVETPLIYASGVEYPGLVLIDADLYEAPDGAGFPMTIAHEVAHQWWYSLVGNDVFDEPWLDEGLATYSSVLYIEDTPGAMRAQDYLDYWRGRWDMLRQAGQDEAVTMPLSYFEQPEKQKAYSPVVYLKSALFYEALREKIGDQAFFSALRKYYQQERYQVASSADLLAIFEQESGQRLKPFYDEWLFNKSKP